MSTIKPLRLALVGNPNCGKTALFNRLTGARQKVANYAGVTVERKEGHFTSAAGCACQIVDLPGAYSLNAVTPDEAITRDVLFGARSDETPPDVIVLVADATNLQLNLRLVLEVLRLQRPTILALNMMDVAQKRGLVIDIAKLQAELGIPVIETVAVKPGGGAALLAQLDAMTIQLRKTARHWKARKPRFAAFSMRSSSSRAMRIRSATRSMRSYCIRCSAISFWRSCYS
jgi:ferrous iron transport protein B